MKQKGNSGPPRKLEGGVEKHLMLPFARGDEFVCICISSVLLYIICYAVDVHLLISFQDV